MCTYYFQAPGMDCKVKEFDIVGIQAEKGKQEQGRSVCVGGKHLS